MTFQRTAMLAAVFLVLAAASGVPGQETKESPPSKKADKTKIEGKKESAKPSSRHYSPEQIIEAFERERPANRPAERREDSGMMPDAPPPDDNLRRDGDYMTNVSGRITQEGDWWYFKFLSDSATLEKAPIRLLPNQQLERIVREQKATSEQILFVVSGEMTLFDNRNYLLLRKALRRPDMGNLQEQ